MLSKRILKCISYAEIKLSILFPDCGFQSSFYGMEFALSGYNILYGYPKNNGRDPGWKEQIFMANFVEDPPRYTSDCSYILPMGVNVKRTVACSTSFKSSEVRTAKDLEKSLGGQRQRRGGRLGSELFCKCRLQRIPFWNEKRK